MQNVNFNNAEEIEDTLTDEGVELFFDRIKDILRNQELTITFTKKDGTDRVMRCTLDPNKLPVKENMETNSQRKVNNDTMAVFDLDAQGWRSFTKKTVKSIDFTTHRS